MLASFASSTRGYSKRSSPPRNLNIAAAPAGATSSPRCSVPITPDRIEAEAVAVEPKRALEIA